MALFLVMAHGGVAGRRRRPPPRHGRVGCQFFLETVRVGLKFWVPYNSSLCYVQSRHNIYKLCSYHTVVQHNVVTPLFYSICNRELLHNSYDTSRSSKPRASSSFFKGRFSSPFGRCANVSRTLRDVVEQY